VTIEFLGNQCNVTLHYLENESFRIAITSHEEVKTNSLFMELEFDEESFGKTIEFINNTFKVKKQVVLVKPGEIQIPSLKTLSKSFINNIMSGITEFET